MPAHRSDRAKPGQARATFARLMELDTDECVLWPHATNSKGYPQLAVDGYPASAHVLACAHHHGPRPEGKQAAHSCGVKLCVNGRHLRWATPAENEADKVAHGTSWYHVLGYWPKTYRPTAAVRAGVESVTRGRVA